MTEDDNGQAVRNHWRASIDGHAVSLASIDRWMKRLTFLVCKFIGGLGSRIDTRSSIDFFSCAKFVDRDDWSNNSAVFVVSNAIILRHLKEKDAWTFVMRSSLKTNWFWPSMLVVSLLFKYLWLNDDTFIISPFFFLFGFFLLRVNI